MNPEFHERIQRLTFASLSGLDPATVPADSVITGEGANLSAAESVSDRAGNTTNAAVAGIKIDRTAPKTTVTAPSGWVNHAVTMTLDADDTLSGVRATYFVLDGGAQQAGTGVTIGTEGVTTVSYAEALQLVRRRFLTP